MTRWITPMVAALALAVAPVVQAQQTQRDGKTESGALTAENFVEQALQSGEKEVAMAKLAVGKASTGELKQFAEILVQDHLQVNEQLRLIADKEGKTGTTPSSPGRRSDAATPPADVSPGAGPSRSDELKKLGALSGKEFDTAFLAIIIEGHERSVSLYESASTRLPDGAARKLANDTLPKIKEHLQQAKNLQAQGDKKN